MSHPYDLVRMRPRNLDERTVIAAYIQQVTTHYLVVTVGGGDLNVPRSNDTYVAGQFCWIASDPKGWKAIAPVTVLGAPDPEQPVVGPAPTPPPPPANQPRPTPVAPKPAPVATKFRWVTLTPSVTDTYRGGWRSDTNNLYQGDWTGRGINTGFAGFGSKIVGLRADTTRSRIVRVQARRLAGGVYAAVTPTWWTTSQGTKPAGNVTRLNADAGTALTIGETDSFDLAATLRDQLLVGTARGLAIFVSGTSPYCQIEGASIRVLVYFAPKP